MAQTNLDQLGYCVAVELNDPIAVFPLTAEGQLKACEYAIVLAENEAERAKVLGPNINPTAIDIYEWNADSNTWRQWTWEPVWDPAAAGESKFADLLES